MTQKINLTWFRESDDYHNHFYFFNQQKEPLTQFLTDLNTNGDVWNEEGTYYPLICSKIMRDHRDHFDFTRPDRTTAHNHFLFRTFVDNQTNTPATTEDLKWLLEMVDNKNNTSKTNKTAAHLFVGHQNPYLRAYAESIVRGKWEDFDFNISEIIPGEIDKLIIEEEA